MIDVKIYVEQEPDETIYVIMADNSHIGRLILKDNQYQVRDTMGFSKGVAMSRDEGVDILLRGYLSSQSDAAL